MKKIVIWSVGTLVVLIALIGIMKALIMIEEKGEPPVFPEMIQNIYRVATVKIDSAVVVRLVNQEYTNEPNYYITQESALREYDGCGSAFLVSPDVIKFYGSSIEFYAPPREQNDRMEIFDFFYPPRKFDVYLQRKFEWYCSEIPDVWDMRYFVDYELALCPEFTRRQWIKIDQDRMERMKKILSEIQEEAEEPDTTGVIYYD